MGQNQAQIERPYIEGDADFDRRSPVSGERLGEEGSRGESCSPKFGSARPQDPVVGGVPRPTFRREGSRGAPGSQQFRTHFDLSSLPVPQVDLHNQAELWMSAEWMSEPLSRAHLGRGFKVNTAVGEDCMKKQIFQTTDSTTIKLGQPQTKEFFEVMNCDKGSDYAGVPTNLGMSYGPLTTADRAGEFWRETMLTTRRSVLCYRKQHICAHSRLGNPLLQRTTWDLDLDGTMFVSQIMWGAQLDVKLIVESEEPEDLSKIMSMMKTQLRTNKVNPNFASKFDSDQSSSGRKYMINILVAAAGVTLVIPDTPSLQQACALIHDFSKRCSELGEENWLPLGFAVCKISDIVPAMKLDGRNSLETQFAKAAEVFGLATYFKARLQTVLEECVQEYNRPFDGDMLDAYRRQVSTSLEFLSAKQDECLRYRELPLAKLLGLGEQATPVPVKASIGDANMMGLIGCACIEQPAQFPGWHYEGFAIVCNGTLTPHLSGFIRNDRDQVIRGRTAEILSGFASIGRHAFNPEKLRTHVQAKTGSDPSCGDLFIPDDMHDILDPKLKPNFRNKTMVLMGLMGSGKTSLYNRITGSQNAVSGRGQTCSVRVAEGHGLGPARELKVKDTPGLSSNTRGGMTVDEAMELRKALTKSPVAQIVIVVQCGNGTRDDELTQPFTGALEAIFSCDAFEKDANGMNLLLKKDLHSPKRPRAFVVFTKRDRMAMDTGGQIQQAVKGLRQAYPFIGPVAFIDERVSLSWIYDTVIACAGYQGEYTLSIPLCELFGKWKMSVPAIKDEWEDHIEKAREEMNDGAHEAVAAIQRAVDENKDVKVHGNFVDMLGPTMDCVIRFMDDLYDTQTQETLAKIYEVEDPLDVWSETNPFILNERANTMNAIKAELAPTLLNLRKKIQRSYPTSGASAVYRKCKNCQAIYLKPTGCNYIGACGAYRAADAGHQGAMDTVLQYIWKDRRLQIQKTAAHGDMETKAWERRSAMREKLGDQFPTYEGFDDDQPQQESGGWLSGWRFALPWGQGSRGSEEAPPLPLQRPRIAIQGKDETKKANKVKEITYGCGVSLNWDDMDPLSADELEKMGLIPQSTPQMSLEPVVDVRHMPIKIFLQRCGPNFAKFEQNFIKYDLNSLNDLDLDGLSEEERTAAIASVLPERVSKLELRVMLKTLREILPR